MEKLNNINDKPAQKISFGVYGILSIIFGGLGDLIAYLMYPEYNFMRKAVSSLCNGPGGLFFQIGTVVSGFFALFFVISLGKKFKEENIDENLIKSTVFTAIISCISFIILGVFCGSNPVIALIHGVNAVISWITGLFYITLFNILFLKSSKYSKFVAYCGFTVTLTLTLLMVAFILHLLPDLRFLMIILPSLEWLNTIALIFWYLVVSTYIIHQRI